MQCIIIQTMKILPFFRMYMSIRKTRVISMNFYIWKYIKSHCLYHTSFIHFSSFTFSLIDTTTKCRHSLFTGGPVPPCWRTRSSSNSYSACYNGRDNGQISQNFLSSLKFFTINRRPGVSVVVLYFSFPLSLALFQLIPLPFSPPCSFLPLDTDICNEQFNELGMTWHRHAENLLSEARCSTTLAFFACTADSSAFLA